MPRTGRMLTVAEAAERLGVTERWMRRAIFEGRIVPHKYGEGRSAPVRVAEAEVERYLEATRTDAR